MKRFRKLILNVWHRYFVNLLAIFFMISGLFLNALFISLTHERVLTDQPPLPDTFFDLIFYKKNLISFTELYITLQNISFFLLLLFSPQREIIFRRFCIICGITYYFRCFCFASTALPPALFGTCLPKLNNTIAAPKFFHDIFIRAAKFSLTFGFASQNDIYLCGDQIFSGHTLIIIIGKY